MSFRGPWHRGISRKTPQKHVMSSPFGTKSAKYRTPHTQDATCRVLFTHPGMFLALGIHRSTLQG